MASTELLKEFDFKEEEREAGISFKGGGWHTEKTGFPEPAQAWRIITEAFNQSIEEAYFWMLNHIKTTAGISDITKITDIFAAAEQSSFFGAAQSRLSIQQDKVSQFLATVGKMVKELFQLVRELRVIDERLGYYEDSWSNSKSRESAEITLKGIWIDLVEQGAKNPASVYGMARELQFITLPDLFFATTPRSAADVDHIVNNMKDFNRKVREVLKRKLRSFMEWKQSTYKEMKTRRKFTLKYLRQHYDIIHMYMNWVKPYLKNIQRLQLADRTQSPELINSFEGAMIEIEVMAKKLPMIMSHHAEPHQNKDVYSVLLINFDFRTRPQMNYMQEGYHKGPIHVGRLEMVIRTYAWTQDEIDRYMKVKERESMELFGAVDTSVKAAMDALGDEMELYLKEAGEPMEDKKAEAKKRVKPPNAGALEPFIAVFKGITEIGSAFLPSSGEGKPKKKDAYRLSKEKGIATKEARQLAFQLYHYFKKDRGMLEWG